MPNPSSSTTPTTRNRIARFNTDGTLDTAFNPDANGLIGTIALQADGKLLVSGGLTSIAGHTINSGFGRINADGSADFSFDPNPNGRATALLPLSNGKILIGGTFTTLLQNGTGTPKSVGRLAMIDSGGALDSSFASTVGGQAGAQVNAVAVQADGKILAGGNFANLGGSSGGGIGRFFPDGVADLTFSPSTDGTVNALVVRPDIGSVVTQGNRFRWVQLKRN